MSHILVFSKSTVQQNWFSATLAPKHIVTIVESAVAAAKTLRSSEVPVDLVIAEWFEYDDLRVIEEIHRMRDITPPPIVLTADIRSNVDRATLQAISHGADWLVTLPMSRKVFLVEVESVISQFGKEAEEEDKSDFAIKPTETASEITHALLMICEVVRMIDQTVGPEYLETMLDATIDQEGMQAAQNAAIQLMQWATSDTPVICAASWSSQYGDTLRTPSQDLLFHVAHGILFRIPPVAA